MKCEVRRFGRRRDIINCRYKECVVIRLCDRNCGVACIQLAMHWTELYLCVNILNIKYYKYMNFRVIFDMPNTQISKVSKYNPSGNRIIPSYPSSKQFTSNLALTLFSAKGLTERKGRTILTVSPRVDQSLKWLAGLKRFSDTKWTQTTTGQCMASSVYVRIALISYMCVAHQRAYGVRMSLCFWHKTFYLRTLPYWFAFVHLLDHSRGCCPSCKHTRSLHRCKWWAAFNKQHSRGMRTIFGYRTV